MIDLAKYNIITKNGYLNPNYKAIVNSYNFIKDALLEYSKERKDISLSQRIYHYMRQSLEVCYCSDCGKPTRYINFTKGFSKKHSVFNCFSYKNSFLGRKHTDATKKKMSENHADFTGDKNPFKNMLNKNPAHRVILSQRMRHTQLRLKSDKYYSERLSNIHANEQHKQRRYSAGQYYSIKIPSVSFYSRSSWERIVAEKLDNCDLVHEYDCESITYPYVNMDDYQRTGRCDFFVKFINGERAIIEVKNLYAQKIEYWKLINQQEYFMLNNIQWAVIDNRFFDSFIFNSILKSLHAGELYVEKYIGRNIVTTTQYFEEMYLKNR